MDRIVMGILVLVSVLPAAAAQDDGRDTPATPAEQYQALAKEFQEAAHVFYLKAQAGEERDEALARLEKLPPQLLEAAEKNGSDPIALDALVQVVNQEMWLENNTSHPGWGSDSPQVRAIAILLQDHVQSDKLGEACRRMSYGFRKEFEAFLRAVLQKNPHRDVQALACLRLAQFLNGRLQRLDRIQQQPELTKRYERLFGKDYLEALRRRDRADAISEAEAFFERAAEEYGDVKVPYGGTVAERAQSELHEIRPWPSAERPRRSKARTRTAGDSSSATTVARSCCSTSGRSSDWPDGPVGPTSGRSSRTWNTSPSP